MFSRTATQSKYILRNDNRGVIALFFVVMVLAVASTLSLSLALVYLNRIQSFEAFSNSQQAYFAAEGGSEDAVYRIKNNLATPAYYTLSVGGAQTEITTTTNGNQKTIQARGTASGDTRAVQASLTITTVNPSFYYGTQVGEGGITMNQNSRVEGAGGGAGNVYSNGAVTGASNATITGDLIVATGISQDVQAQSTACNADQIFSQADPIIDVAQSFTPSQSQSLAKISIYIKKIGNPGDRTIRIVSNDNGSPSDTILASATLSSNLVTTSYGWIDVTFNDPASLTQGTTYWIVFDASKNSNHYWSWCKDSAQGYAGGQPKYSKEWYEDPWISIIGDLAFKTYLGIGLSSIDSVIVLGNAKVNTITNSKICGDAYYQTIDASSLNFLNAPSSPTCSLPLTNGTAHPSSPDPPVSNMPISQSNIDQWKQDAVAIINGNCGDGGVAECVIGDNNTLSLGLKTITGNLTLTKKQTLVVTGTLYVQGYISLDSSGGATIKCDLAYAAQGCVIITDSWIHIKNNAIFQGSGTQGSYLMFISTLAGCNGGDEEPQCTHHNAGVDIHNNATGAIFYVPNSMANLHNGVTVTELTAYKLSLDNGAIVQYEQGLFNALFSSGPGGSFNITGWGEIP